MFKVILQSCGNPGHGAPIKASAPTFAVCKTIEDCSSAVREYIDRYNLGAGNWCGGQIVDFESNLLVGYISYNGRVWTPQRSCLAPQEGTL